MSFFSTTIAVVCYLAARGKTATVGAPDRRGRRKDLIIEGPDDTKQYRL